MTAHLARAAALAFVTVAVAGCPTPPVARPYPPPKATELVAHLRRRAEAVRSLRAEARVDYLAGRGERIAVTMTFLVERPGRLRADAESPLGGAALSLASDGTDFQLLDGKGNRFLTGPAEPCNIARFLRVALRPADLVDVIAGGAPLLGEPVSVGWDPSHGGREVLTLRDGGLTETIRVAPRTWDVVEAEVTGADGKVVHRLVHEDFSDEGGLRFPGKTRLVEPARDADAKLRFRSREPNVELPAAAFRIAAPPGLPVETVRCGGPSTEPPSAPSAR